MNSIIKKFSLRLHAFVALSLGVMLLAPLASAQAVGTNEWATVNHVSLRYRIDGAGDQVLVLVQESGVPLEVWDEILPSLATPGRKIVRYDPRGIGLSEKFRGPVTMQNEVDDLRALLQALGIQSPVTLIAGALGGSVAMQYAAAYPQGVRGLFVTSPSALLVPKAPRPRIDPAVDPEGYLVAQQRGWKVTYPESLRGNTRRWQRFQAMESIGDFESEVATEALINTTPFADVLPKIQCPSMLVATALFPRPVESVKALVDAMPNARLAVLQTGHMAYLQSPELVAPLLESFLKDIGS